MVRKSNVVNNYAISMGTVDRVHPYISINCFMSKSQMVLKVNFLDYGYVLEEFIHPLPNYDEEKKLEAIDTHKICETFSVSMCWKIF